MFFVVFLATEACGIPTPQAGIKPMPLALEGKVLATGPPGKSQDLLLERHEGPSPQVPLWLAKGYVRISQVSQVHWSLVCF